MADKRNGPTVKINGKTVTLDDVKDRVLNAAQTFRIGIIPVAAKAAKDILDPNPKANPTPAATATAPVPTPAAPVSTIPAPVQPLGIEIPENFQVTSHPIGKNGSKVTKGKYVHLIAQMYDTADDDNVDTGQFREFVAMRKMAATVLPMCPATDEYLLIRQFRFPAYYNTQQNSPHTFDGSAEENGWLYEAIAGVIEPNENPDDTVIKEAKEEGNIDITHNDIRKVHHCFMTPGITNEEMHIYLAIVASTTNGTSSTGLASEQELIRARWMKASEIRELHAKGLIRDAKTIMALYAARVL